MGIFGKLFSKASEQIPAIRIHVTRQCRYRTGGDRYKRSSALEAAYRDIKRAAPGPEVGKPRFLIDPAENVNSLVVSFEVKSTASAAEFRNTVDRILREHGFEFI
jgi:hypothetical protein